MSTPTTCHLTFYADLVCPFSFAADEALLPEIRDTWSVEIDWQPFELHPGTPGVGFRYPARDAGRIWSSARRLLESVDLPVSRRAPGARPNTHSALCGAEAARAHGVLERYRGQAYRAYFVDGADLADRAVIAALVPEADLNDPRWSARVASARADADRLGITSAPALRVGDTAESGRTRSEGLLYGMVEWEQVERFLGGAGAQRR